MSSYAGHARIGKALEALGMDVRYYYTRHNDLARQLKGAGLVIDRPSLNPATTGFYDEVFFAKVDDNAVFVTVGSNKIKDIDAVLRSLENGKFCGTLLPITPTASSLMRRCGIYGTTR